MRRRMNGIHEGYNRPNRRRLDKVYCPVCRFPLDDYHDNARCHAAWNERCDREARQRARGETHE